MIGRNRPHGSNWSHTATAGPTDPTGSLMLRPVRGRRRSPSPTRAVPGLLGSMCRFGSGSPEAAEIDVSHRFRQSSDCEKRYDPSIPPVLGLRITLRHLDATDPRTAQAEAVHRSRQSRDCSGRIPCRTSSTSSSASTARCSPGAACSYRRPAARGGVIGVVEPNHPRGCSSTTAALRPESEPANKSARGPRAYPRCHAATGSIASAVPVAAPRSPQQSAGVM